MFPSKYRKGAFIAEHGSWNRSSKVGYRVVFVQIEGKKVIEEEVFVGGWLQAQSVSGRPVDILELPDGSILISDDHGGKIYRVSYEEKSKNSPSSQ
jgi:glucose/arabinose dehydrogenase